METDEVGFFIGTEIEKKHNSMTKFCTENEIGYMKFANKLKNIKNGKDFRFRGINRILNLLGYKFAIVKLDDKKTHKM